MTKYKFSADSDRYTEYSSNIGMIWFDQGEWELSKSLDLISDIPKFFSPSWQKSIAQDKMHKLIEEKYKERFGEDYEDILNFKIRFKNKKTFSEMITYLGI